MRRVFILLSLLMLSACVTTEEFDRVRAELNDTRRDTVELRKDLDVLRERTTGTVKEDSLTALRESQGTMNTRLNDLSSSHQELRGRFEENRYFVEKSLKENGIEKELIRTQIAGLETQVKALREKLSQFEAEAAKPKETEKPAQQGEAVKEQKTSSQPEKVEEKKAPEETKPKTFDAANQEYKEKRYKEARELFEKFIREEPKSDLADNAQFMIGESFYQEKDFESAILAYEALLKKYPGSDKTTAALYKQALAFIEIGDAKTGRIILAKLIEKHPDAKEADAARKKIAELDKKPAKKK